MKRKPRKIWVSKETFLLVESRQKDLLVRSDGWMIAFVSVGDVVEIWGTIANKERRCLRRVTACRRYETMLSIVEHEDLTRLAHGNEVQTLSYLARIYSPQQEESHAVVLELKPIT